MAKPMTKTRHAGIYKRGGKYVFRYRAGGTQYAESADTLEEARQKKTAREAARDRGEHDQVTQARTPFREYAEEWVDRYQGNGRRGFNDDTREEYRRDLRRYAYPLLGGLRLGSITPRTIAEVIAWLCDEEKQGRRVALERREIKAARLGVPAGSLPLEVEPVRISDATVRRIMAPIRACFATARREGLIRSNPADNVPLPVRPQIEDTDPQIPKALTRDELATFLRIAPPRWRVFFEVLASTGLRWGEIGALQWRDLELEGSEAHLKVRRALARRKAGRPLGFKPPKSGHSVRDIPLGADLCRALRARRKASEFGGEDDLVFCASNGAILRHENVTRRILKPTAEEVGVPWAGLHTFRHTAASLSFAAGRNAKQVQRLLGHHSPAFTLATYVHLLDDGIGGALELGEELDGAGLEGESKVRTQAPGSGRIAADRLSPETVT